MQVNVTPANIYTMSGPVLLQAQKDTQDAIQKVKGAYESLTECGLDSIEVHLNKYKGLLESLLSSIEGEILRRLERD